jgi:hypothetical protein
MTGMYHHAQPLVEMGSPVTSNISINSYYQAKDTGIFFLPVLEFELRAYTLSHSTNPFFCDGFFQDGIL